MNRQRVTRIRGSDERAPANRPQTKLSHDAPNAFAIGVNPSAFQLPLDTAVTITGEFLMNPLDLLTKLLIIVITFPGVFGIWLVVIAAGSQLAYLAGFRNRSKFSAVITDVSTLLCR